MSMLNNKNVQLIILILILIIGLDSGYSALKGLSSYVVPSQYEGARPLFAGIRYGDTEYTGTDQHDASQASFDTMLAFDPDQANSGMCNLHGEMTTAFIPEESLSNMPDWIPRDWIRQTALIGNPVGEYPWEIGNYSYIMEEWVLRWYFSLSAEWEEVPAWGWVTDPELADVEWRDKIYSNTEIWFSIDLTSKGYIEGATNTYFSIAKMQIADVRVGAQNWADEEVEAWKDLSVTPESGGSVLPIYHGLFAKSNPAEKEAYEYKGKKLNPDIFTDKVYSYIRLNHFGTHSWVEWAPLLTDRYSGDVVTFAINLHVFVIGEWTVKDIQKLEDVEGEDGYGRTALIGGAQWSLGDWFSLPENRLLVLLAIGFIGFMVLVVLFPSVLMTIVAIFGSGRRR